MDKIQNLKIAASVSDVAPANQSITLLMRQLQTECEAMLRYSLSSGLVVPSELVEEYKQKEELMLTGSVMDNSSACQTIKQLTIIHQALAKVIAPAMPGTIMMLDNEKRMNRKLFFLGPVPLIRQLSLIAIGFLIMLIMVGLQPSVDIENINMGFLRAEGISLLFNLAFLLSCAGLGASFAALFQANSYIASSTYDSKYDSSYFSRIILGVIAGLIIVELLPSDLFESGTMQSFGKPALAMLGGFSASLVYRILQRMVEAAESLVKGDMSTISNANLAVQKSQIADEKNQLKLQVVNAVMELQRSLEGKPGCEEIKQLLNDFLKNLMPTQKF